MSAPTQDILSLAKLRGIWEAGQANGLPVPELSAAMTEMLDELKAGRLEQANRVAGRIMGDHAEVGASWIASFMADVGCAPGCDCLGHQTGYSVDTHHCTDLCTARPADRCGVCHETGGDHTLACPTRWYR